MSIDLSLIDWLAFRWHCMRSTKRGKRGSIECSYKWYPHVNGYSQVWNIKLS